MTKNDNRRNSSLEIVNWKFVTKLVSSNWLLSCQALILRQHQKIYKLVTFMKSNYEAKLIM